MSQRKGKAGASVAASRTLGGATKVSASTSRRPGPGEANSARPQIIDALGRNLTPKPLALTKAELAGGADATGKSRAAGGTGGTFAASGVSVASDGDLGGDTQSAGGFTHSVTSETESGGPAEGADEGGAEDVAGDDAGVADTPSIDAHGVAIDTARNALVPIESDVDFTATWTRSSGLLREALLDAMVTVTLSETDTVMLFELASVRVQQDSAESRLVAASNQRYETLCTTISKSSAELFPSRASETLVPPTKHKEVMVAPASVANAAAQVDSFDLLDTIAATRSGAFASSGGAATGTSGSRRSSGSAATLDRAVSAVMALSLAATGCQLDADGSVCVIPSGMSAAGAQHAAGPVNGAGRSGLPGASAIMARSGRGRQAATTTLGSTTASLAAAPSSVVPDQRRSSGAGPASTVNASSTSDVSGGALPAEQSPQRPSADAIVLTDLVLDAATRAQATKVFDSRALLNSLMLVERAVQQNLYHEAHRRYRGGPAIDLVEGLLAAGASGGHAAAAVVLAQAVGGSSAAGGRGAPGVAGVAKPPEGGVGMAVPSVQPPQASAATAVNAPPPPRTGGGASKHRAGQPFQSGLDAPIEEGEEDEEDEDDRANEDEESSRGRSENSGDFEGVDNSDDGDGVDEGTEGAAVAGVVATSAAAATASAGVPPTTDATNAPQFHVGAPSLQRLWSYYTPLVNGLNVSGMDWNKTYRDLLAVGYGPYDLTTSQAGRGLVALWAITNPEYPQAILRTHDDIGVTSVAFSTAHPNMLAAGLYDGSVCVWDTRQLLQGGPDCALPVMLSDQLLPGAHSEAVWGVKWVQKNDLGEVLVSVSTDGRVTQWDTKKGLVPTPIMTLKRARAPPGSNASAALAPTNKAPPGGMDAGVSAQAVTSEALGATGSEGLLSRTASGLTIDFVKEDPSQYFVGTEDGLVAQCSTSYSEQYLSTLQAHAGPVSRISLSPFLSHALLTASADWTVRLWNLQAAKPLPVTFSVDSIRDTVTDVAWSPSMSTLFTAVTRDGHITVWDVAHLSPLIDHTVTIEPEAWAAILAAEAAAQAAAEAAAAEEALRRRREARGEDDAASDGEEASAMAAAATMAVESAHAVKRAERGPGGADDPTLATGSTSESSATRQPPRKKLSCVLFADNTHVLVTGDSSGRVDVYRVVGLQRPAETGTDIAGGSSAAPVGSEAHEAQLEALATVLSTMVESAAA